MQVRSGIAVSPGVVVGPALVLGSESFRIPQKFVSRTAVEVELVRFQTALERVCRDIEEHEILVGEKIGSQYAAIFSAHLQMARDPKLVQQIEDLITEQNYSPEYAVSKTLRKLAEQMQNLGDRYLAERALDIFDLEKRLLRELLGERREELSNLTEPVIILAHDLTPGETATLNTDFVLGFATEVGGHTSHTAILAGALEIPAVVGLGRCLAGISGGERVILDGDHGQVVIEPDEKTTHRYRDSQERNLRVIERLASLESVESVTKDGVRINTFGNIEFPEEVEHCIKRGADGIGLYRTEFLYLGKNSEPTEEDHYEAYCNVLKACGDRSVVIRTLDIGADKIPPAFGTVLRPARIPCWGCGVFA